MEINAKEIAAVLGVSLPGRPSLLGNEPVRHLLTDSRSLREGAGTLFFALRTERGDGHLYLRELYERGVRMFAVQNLPPNPETFPDAVWLQVPDTMEALRKVGSLGRALAERTLAITGSRGKTSLKEWLFRLLSPSGNVYRSPRSFNSQTGVPLSLWDIPSGTRLAILEAGISKHAEMEKLRDCIEPDSVILTNLLEDHSEGFSSPEEKLREKLLLAAGPRTRFLVAPSDLLPGIASSGVLRTDFPVVTWKVHGEEPSDSAATEGDLAIWPVDGGHAYSWRGCRGSALAGCCPPETGRFELGCGSRADVENAAAALAWMMASGVGAGPIRRWGGELRHVRTRLDVSEGVNGCTLFSDSYSPDMGSLLPALDFVARRKTPGQRLTLVSTDLTDSRHDPRTLYTSVANAIREAGISRLIGVGSQFMENADLFADIESQFFATPEEALKALRPSDFSNEALLLSGGDGGGVDRIGEMLRHKTHQTVLEVDLGALVDNYNYFRSKLRPGVEVVAMVKASGYGAGSFEVARTLQDAGAAYLAVAVLDEGIELRRRGISMPIMVMNPRVTNYREMFGNRLEPEIYTLEMLAEVAEAARREGHEDYPVHLKLDTGMHRMGLVEEELPKAVEILNGQRAIRVSSVFSHLATADCPDMDDYTLRQLQLFQRLTDRLAHELAHPFRRHILNSAGILRFPEYDYDMVRLGIGLYGANTLPPEMEKPLAVVSSLRTVVIAVREWKAGESIGYGRRTILKRDSMIATLPIGYADGMNRRFGNGAVKVLVNGQEAPTAGNICMDACMVDVTGLDCKVGDPVEIFGPQAPLSRLSDLLETIPYEVLTSVSPRVKRIYFRE